MKFELYLKMIDDKYKFDKGLVKENLFNNTKILFLNDENCDFILYISLFVEGYNIKDFIKKYIYLFHTLIKKKIKITQITKERLEKVKEIMNILIKNPKMISNMYDEKTQKLIFEITCKVIFLYNFLLQRDSNNYIEMLKNKEINNILFKFICKDFSLFENLILNKETLNELVKIADNFEDIEKCLRFNHDFLIILEVLVDNYDFIKLKYNASKNKHPIKLEDYVFPKEEDNINDIIANYSSLLFNTLDGEKNLCIIPLPNVILEKYVEFYNNTSGFNNLLRIKNLIDSIKKINKAFNVKNFNRIFHNIGLQLINEGKFDNDKILSFVKQDYYYSDENVKDRNKMLELIPIQKFNLEKVEKNELEKWRKINWVNIYKNQIDEFLLSIFCLIKNLKDFKNIFKLLMDDPNFNLHKNSITILMINFLYNFDKESRENLIENLGTIKTIVHYYMLYYKKTDLLENLLNNFDKHFVMNLFVEILVSEKFIKEVFKKFFMEFIDKQIKTEIPQILFELIMIIGNRNANILNKLNNYIIDEISFFSFEENIKMKLLKLLVVKRILPDKDSKNSFLNKSYENIDYLRNKIFSNNFSYNDLYKFFQKEEGIISLKERLGLLHLINIKDDQESGRKYDDSFEEKKFLVNEIIDSIKNKFNEIYSDIKYIEIIINDFSIFYPNSHKLEIEEYNLLINNYKKQTIYNKEKMSEYQYKINEIKNEFSPGAEDRIIKKESLFFKSIYEKERKNIDEMKALIETNKKFDKMVKILDINLADEKLIKIYIEGFKNKTKEEVTEEIVRLAKIFDKKNVLIDELADKYIILSYKENIINVVNAIKLFIEQTEVKKTEYYKNLETIIFYCQNNSDIEIINICKDILGFDLKNKENKFYNIFTSLAKIPESIKYLFSKNENDCRILHGIVNNGDDANFLTSADVLHFQKCVSFMNGLGKLEEIKSMTDYDIISKASNLFVGKGDKNFDLYFISLVDNFQRIKELINQEFNKSEALRLKIKSICEESEFSLSNKEKNYFSGNYSLNKKEINFEELEDLNIRIQMTMKISTDSEEILKIFQHFTELMNDITKIQSMSNEIYVRGYPKEFKISIKINENKKHYEFAFNNKEKEKNNNINEMEDNEIIDNRNIKEVKHIFSKLKNILQKWKKVQKEGYKNFEFLRYIFGRQFNILYKHLTKETKNKKFISHFLRYITNNKLKIVSDNYNWINKNGDELENIIYNFNEFINQNLIYNKLSLKDIYSNAKIVFDEYKGFYLYFCLDKIEKILYKLYKYLTNNNPVPQNILFCNVDTSKEEIESFLYRAILCKENSCFIIGGIELLEFGPKNYLVEFLNEIISEYGNEMNSCLIVLTFDKTTDIHKTLDSLKYTKKFQTNIFENIKEQKLEKNDNIKIVCSDKSGIGKSNKIKEMILDSNNFKYKYFPIGSMFSEHPRKDIFNRLEKLRINDISKISIHIDLYDNDDIDLMTDFLFQILILKSYKKEEDIIMLPSDIHIYIEIPNSFIDFEEKFPILFLIPDNKDMKIKLLTKDFPSLKYTQEEQNLKSNLQIVCNYLKLRKEKKIDDFDQNLHMRIYIMRKKI